MQAVVEKKSHEDLWLQEGHLLALQFSEGWVCTRILGKEHSNVKPYVLSASLAAGGSLAAWNTLADAAARRYPEPPEEDYIHHYFWGVNKPKVRVYFQYQSRDDRNSLVEATRALGGDVGYVDGDMSPYNGPFSLKTEFISVFQIYPAVNLFNPLADAMPLVALNLDVMRYSYEIIKDPDTIRSILLGGRRARTYTVGGIDPSPVSIPNWLANIVSKDVLKWTKAVVRGETA